MGRHRDGGKAHERVGGMDLPQQENPSLRVQDWAQTSEIQPKRIAEMDGVEETLTSENAYYTYCNTMKGRELKRARSRLGMTQKQLGEELGVHWNSVARMEADY